jgi:hypothetical protein
MYGIDPKYPYISCYTASKQFTGNRYPMTQEQLQTYYLKEQADSLERMQLNQIVQQSAVQPRYPVYCQKIGNMVTCN